MSVFVVVEGTSGVSSDPGVADLAADIGRLEGVDTVIGPHLGVAELANDDDTVALLQVTYTDDSRAEERAIELLDLVGDHEGALSLSALGDATVTHEFNELAESNLRQAEVLGLPIALVILLLVFGAAVAALIPLMTAIVAIIGAVGLTAFVGQFIDLSFFVVNMITMIGLSVGIDYTLLVVQRYREEHRGHRPAGSFASCPTPSCAVWESAIVMNLLSVGAAYGLLGDRNWYFPSWLEWIPKIAVEGHIEDAPDDAGREVVTV